MTSADDASARLERFESAIGGARIGVWEWRARDRALIIDPGFRRLLGEEGCVDDASLDPDAANRLVHPEDAPTVIERFAAHARGDTPIYESNHRLRTRDGRWLWVHNRGRAVERDENGAPLRITGVLFDDSARHEALDRLALAVRGAALGMWDFRPAEDCTTVSERSAQILGLRIDQVGTTTQWWQACMHQDDAPAVNDAVGAVVRGERQSFEAECRLRHADGGWRWIQLLGGVTQRAADGSPLRVTGTHLDITGRKAAEAARRESETRFRVAFELAPTGMCLCDLDGRFLQVNREWCAMLGYSEAELLRRDVASVTHPDDVAMTRGRFARRRAGEDTIPPVEKRYLRKDGGVVWGRADASVVLDSEGRRSHIVVVIQDLTAARAAATDRSRLEEQLRRSQRIESIGLLAGGVAHDFNNLLLPILGWAELSREHAHDAEQAERLDRIVEAAQRARDLVRQLLAFGRKQRLELKPIDLAAEVARLEPILRRVVRENIAIEIDAASAPVRGDASQLQQIVMNLAVNANDAMPDGGLMRIATARARLGAARDAQLAGLPDGDYAVLTVADTGVGIDPQTRARLFEPFFTTKEVGKGTGLGLATVHGIVKQHGGEVAVASAPGAGTTFAVWLPACAEALPEPSPLATPVARGAERVLVVEDEPLVRELVVSVLKDQGYRVQSAPDPDAALRLASDGFDLLVTDVIMPGLDGQELHRRLRARWPGLRAVFISGYTGDVVDPVRLGQRFLQKPFAIGSLAQTVRQALDERE